MPTQCLKFRLYPTPAQETALCRTLDVCRDVYNSLLNERRHDYEVQGKAPSRYEQQKHFPEWAKTHDEIKAVFSQVLQNVAVRVDLACNAFFTRLKRGDKPGFPRFKGEGYDSFTYPQAGFQIGPQSVSLSKIGTVQAVLHRPVVGRVKTCTVRRQSEKWYVCFAVAVEPEPLPPSEEAVGLDVGLEKFAALSHGEFVANPRFLRKDEKALAKAQRKADKLKAARTREQKAKRRKANKVVRRIHERIRHRRHNFVHQTARKLVNRYGLIAVEKLNVQGMQGNHCLAKSISDAAWSMFRQVLAEKAESAGRKVVNVNPAYTSQDCSGCGYRAKKKLSERWHYCPQCGLSLDRDTNAARNLLKIGMGQHTVAGIPA